MDRLNLGCSNRHKKGYVNIDMFPPADVLYDLSVGIPYPDSSIEHIIADDIIEHLPDKVFTMNELWRVLIPGGEVDIFVPTTDGRGAFQDPSHVSYWNRNSFFYYTEGVPEHTRFQHSLGVKCAFSVVSEQSDIYPNSVTKLHICLKAVK